MLIFSSYWFESVKVFKWFYFTALMQGKILPDFSSGRFGKQQE